MTAINFPDSPTSNQIFTSGGISWRWSSTLGVWEGIGQAVAGPAGADGVDGVTGPTGPSGDPTLTIVQKTSSASTALSDASKLIEFSNASPLTFTIKEDSVVDLPIGSQISVLQTGVGQLTIDGDVAVTINASPGKKLRTQWSSATLIKRAQNLWVVTGDLSA